jgi:uncharacterized protein YbgA (DUF1722 family)/uncharacterized protein YbbK (DUF523 family)
MRPENPVEPRLRVGVSACLVGEKVRFDGGHKRDPFLTEVLGRWVEWVPVCPEVELGLGVPRETLRLEGDPAAPRLVAKGGADRTAAMRRLAARRVATLRRMSLVGYVLKKDSPSCGMERVRVYGDGGGAPRRTGVGLFARALMDAMPFLPVEEEGRLDDPALRENFVERLFAADRWRRFVAGGPTRHGLVAFHTAHKLLLLAHSPSAYACLGRLVARPKTHPLAEVLDHYAEGFMAALRELATPRRHANVLEHMLGCLRDGLAPAERRELVDLIADHRRGLVPLVAPITLFRHHIARQDVAYLAGQVYLAPTPPELMLRNHA